MYEVRGLHEWGLVNSYRDYWTLPEPVKVAWRLAAKAESDALEEQRRRAEAG